MGTRKTREELDAETPGEAPPAADPAQEAAQIRAEEAAVEAEASALVEQASPPQTLAPDIPPGPVAAEPPAPDAVPAAVEETPGRAADPALLGRIKMILESLLFAAGDPLPAATLLEAIREVQEDLSPRGLREVIESLRAEFRDQGRGVRVVEVGGGFQLRTPSESAPFVRLLVSRRPPRMTRPTLETLAIAAYRQPVTRSEIEDIRGVDSGAVLKHLLERKLVKIIGRKDEPGKPLLYGTTREFLTLFSLKDLKSLPTLRDFVELSNEHRAALGLAPLEEAASQSGEESGPPAEDFLRPEESTAYTPVGDDEFVQELAEALDELRKRDRKLRQVLPVPKEKEEPEGAANATTEGVPATPAPPGSEAQAVPGDKPQEPPEEPPPGDGEGRP